MVHKLAPCLEDTETLFIAIEGTGTSRLMSDLEQLGADADWDEEALLNELGLLGDEDSSEVSEVIGAEADDPSQVEDTQESPQ